MNTKKIVGTGFYRNAAPGTFGPNEWLDLLMACQDGRATCMRVMEIIDRETVPVADVEHIRATMLQVCCAIEAIPAGEKQTDASIKAATVLRLLTRTPPSASKDKGEGKTL